jgi:hypothetical protein
MLSHYGYPARVVIGVPDDRPLGPGWTAHAWVALDGSDRGVEGFREIARFAV